MNHTWLWLVHLPLLAKAMLLETGSLHAVGGLEVAKTSQDFDVARIFEVAWCVFKPVRSVMYGDLPSYPMLSPVANIAYSWVKMERFLGFWRLYHVWYRPTVGCGACVHSSWMMLNVRLSCPHISTVGSFLAPPFCKYDIASGLIFQPAL